MNLNLITNCNRYRRWLLHTNRLSIAKKPLKNRNEVQKSIMLWVDYANLRKTTHCNTEKKNPQNETDTKAIVSLIANDCILQECDKKMMGCSKNNIVAGLNW